MYSDGSASKHLALAKAGILVLLISWLIISGSTLFSFLPSQRDMRAEEFRYGSWVWYPGLGFKVYYLSSSG